MKESLGVPSSVNIERIRWSIQAGLAMLAIGAGIGLFAWLAATRTKSALTPYVARLPDVLVQTTTAGTKSAPVVGHGSVRPRNQINIVPQVHGTLTFVHSDMAQGKIIPKGAVLFEIDRTIYESRVRQAQGDVRALEALLARHEQEAANLEKQMETARELLAIDEQEYQSSKTLFEDEKVGTRRDLDAVHQRFLRQKSALTELESKHAMIPHLQLETQAQLDSAKARLSQADFDLAATTIRCPFEARVESIGANRSQYVTAHLSIATLTDVEAVEISVGVDPRELQWLAPSIRPDALGRSQSAVDLPPVTVRWTLRGQEFVWKGRVTRFEKIDEATRTARMVVEVRKEELVAGAGRISELTTGLSIGLFVAAELPSAPLQDAILVPRHAIHENQWVFVLVPDEGTDDPDDGTLERRRVPLLRSIGDEVLVDYRGRDQSQVCELAAGEKVVVSSLKNPIEGMRVRMREPAATAQGPAQQPWPRLTLAFGAH